MPDCSGVAVQFIDPPCDHGNEYPRDCAWENRICEWLMRIAQRRGLELPEVVEPGEIADWDCPWGATGFFERYGWVLRALRLAKISHVMYDFGHYTWDGDTHGWEPGMPGYAWRSSGVEGTPFVTSADLDRVRSWQELGKPASTSWRIAWDFCSYQAIRDHLEGPPSKWLNQPSPPPTACRHYPADSEQECETCRE